MYSNPQPEKLDYLLSLRGLAALGVVLGHAFTYGPYSVGVYIANTTLWHFSVDGLFDRPLGPLRDILFVVTPLLGTNFVLLFFALSGYLMGKIFHDRKYDISWRGIARFYENRYFRLAPLLYFNLLVGACFFSYADLSPVKLIGDFLFITNFTGRGVNLVTWSLAHEMQYYLLAPFVFRFFGSVDYGALRRLILSTAIVYAVTRRGFLAHFDYLYIFLVGYAVNLAVRLWPMMIKRRLKLMAIALSIIAINVVYNWLFLRGHEEYARLSVVLVSAVVIFVTECPSADEVSPLRPWLAFIFRGMMLTGLLSYGIYLWHFMVIVGRFQFFTNVTDIISNITGLTAPWEKILCYHAVQLSLTLAVTYALAAATFHLIEVRFRPGLYEPVTPSAS